MAVKVISVAGYKVIFYLKSFCSRYSFSQFLDSEYIQIFVWTIFVHPGVKGEELVGRFGECPGQSHKLLR